MATTSFYIWDNNRTKSRLRVEGCATFDEARKVANEWCKSSPQHLIKNDHAAIAEYSTIKTVREVRRDGQPSYTFDIEDGEATGSFDWRNEESKKAYYEAGEAAYLENMSRWKKNEHGEYENDYDWEMPDWDTPPEEWN